MMAQMHADMEDAGVEGALRVVVVCTGNICRSPMAEVVLRALCSMIEVADGRRLVELVDVESAGTANWHAGDAMDPRARAALDAAGYAGPGTVAVQVTASQLAAAHLVVALDRSHRAELLRMAPAADVTLLRWWAEGEDLDVPDPYYGDAAGFDACLALIVPGCRALASALGARFG
jgi:low molecular weight protein-tyrosine phosphatase